VGVVQGGSNSAAGVREGDILAGKYRVERVLGIGGMGVVVAAHHIQLDEKVALKFLLPDALYDSESVSRFAREARAAVKIKSEHVARVIDVGTLPNGAPYMVMEYLEGHDLSVLLEKHGALPIGEVVEFVLQACEAIADAHALGIVHRDLKPANLFRTERSDGQPSIKVLDFGISKVTTPGAPGHDMTKSSALLGSPLYMSPEQMKLSKSVDARTDIWSLGVILFELLTGHPPFSAEAVTELAIKVAQEPAPLLRAFRFDAPEGLEQVIAKCLEKDRARRFQTVGELAIALGGFAPRHARISVDRVLGTLRRAGMSGAIPSSPGEFQATGGSSPQTSASWGKTGAGTKKMRRNVLVGASVIAGLMAVTAGLVFVARKSSEARVDFAAAASHPDALPPAAPPPPPASSAPPTAAASSVTPTISLSDLPMAPMDPVRQTPAPNRVAPARPVPSTPNTAAVSSKPISPMPSAKPAYNPLEHL
jgi:serine/threonine-protein kinase